MNCSVCLVQHRESDFLCYITNGGENSCWKSSARDRFDQRYWCSYCSCFGASWRQSCREWPGFEAGGGRGYPAGFRKRLGRQGAVSLWNREADLNYPHCLGDLARRLPAESASCGLAAFGCIFPIAGRAKHARPVEAIWCLGHGRAWKEAAGAYRHCCECPPANNHASLGIRRASLVCHNTSVSVAPFTRPPPLPLPR